MNSEQFEDDDTCWCHDCATERGDDCECCDCSERREEEDRERESARILRELAKEDAEGESVEDYERAFEQEAFEIARAIANAGSSFDV